MNLRVVCKASLSLPSVASSTAARRGVPTPAGVLASVGAGSTPRGRQAALRTSSRSAQPEAEETGFALGLTDVAGVSRESGSKAHGGGVVGPRISLGVKPVLGEIGSQNQSGSRSLLVLCL